MVKHLRRAGVLGRIAPKVRLTDIGGRVLIRPLLVTVCLGGASSLAAAGQAVPSYQAREVARVGGIDAPEHATFSWLPALALNRDGTIYARVAAESRIVVFDSNGRFLRTIGRRGNGPGEFITPTGHGFLADTLWVASGPAPRLSIFGPDGRHLHTRRMEYPTLQLPILADLQNVSALLQGGMALFIPGNTLAEPPGRVTLPVMLGARDMRRVDTITVVSRPEGLLLQGVGTLSYYPFPASPLVAVSPDGSGVVTAAWQDVANAPVRVRRINARGAVLWERLVALSSSRIPSRMRDSVTRIAINRARPHVERESRRPGVAHGLPSVEVLVARGLVLPMHFPPVVGLIAGADGTTWLKTSSNGPGEVWAVLNPAGVREFDVVVPTGVHLQQATRDVAWGTATDEDGVHFLVRLAIRR